MDVLNSESDIGLRISCELKRHWRTRAGRRGHCHFVFTRHEHEGWNFTGAGSFLWRGECQMRPAFRGCEVLDWNVTKRHEVPLWGKPRTNESDLNGVGRSCGSLGRHERFDHGARRLRTVDAGRLGARECPHDRQDQGQGAGNWHVAEYRGGIALRQPLARLEGLVYQRETVGSCLASVDLFPQTVYTPAPATESGFTS